jgi:hypothetical protein
MSPHSASPRALGRAGAHRQATPGPNCQLLGLVTLGAFVLGPALAGANDNPQKSPVAASAPASPGCLTVTGSRLPQKAPQCAGFGRSYTDQDLSQTGLTSVGDALGHLDPAITVHK